MRSGRWKRSGVARPKLGAAGRGGADRHRAGAAVERDGAALDRARLDGRRGRGRLARGPPIPTFGAHCQITGKLSGETSLPRHREKYSQA